MEGVRGKLEVGRYAVCHEPGFHGIESGIRESMKVGNRFIRIVVFEREKRP